jgi:hypothetical protein
MTKLHVEFAEKLSSLSLGQYYELLTSNGFDSWEAVQQITENDMEKLQMKRGIRRKLLRAIATNQGYPISQPLTDPSMFKISLNATSAPEDERTGLYPVPSPKETRQCPSERNKFSAILLRAEHPVSVNCSDSVNSK